MKLNLLKFFLLLSVAVFYTACGDEEDITPAPVVTTATTVKNVDNGATGQTVDFGITLASGVTATYAAIGSGVTVTNPTGTATTGTVTINFDAGTMAGAASITLTVTDSENKSGSATAVINIGVNETQVIVTNNITSNTTWTADKEYVLAGRITVTSGATLTIQPGTVIKGQAGTGANATALLVARGGKLIADGTAALPIIFTSVADEITGADIAAGNFGSPNLSPDVNGLWGGVLILGKARISASVRNPDGSQGADLSEVQIEGIPTSDPNGLYGGSDDADNSGVIRYISIRHGGTNIGNGNEINGLTLGGVGSGTVIENIEVVGNQDDGVEWFGGSVNVKNVVVWNAGDDGIDTDQSWSGTLDNFVVVTPAGHCFELDGPEGTYAAGHIIKNGTVVASSAERTSEDLINVDNNSIVALESIFITGIAEGQIINRTAPTGNGVTFTDIIIDILDGTTITDYIPAGATLPAGIMAGTTPRADVSVLGWTWAAKAGGLDGL